jgi:hypothetical protein
VFSSVFIRRRIRHGIPPQVQLVAAVKDENLQSRSKKSVEDDGGGFHGGSVFLAAVRRIAMNQLPSKKQEPVNQFPGEVIHFSLDQPAVDFSGDLLMRAELFGTGLHPPGSMKERTSVDLHQEIGVFAEDGEIAIGVVEIKRRKIYEKPTPRFALSEILAVRNMSLSPERIERDHSKNESEISVVLARGLISSLGPREAPIDPQVGAVGISTPFSMCGVERLPGFSNDCDGRNFVHERHGRRNIALPPVVRNSIPFFGRSSVVFVGTLSTAATVGTVTIRRIPPC